MPEPIHPFSIHDLWVFVLHIAFIIVLGYWKMSWVACNWDIENLPDNPGNPFVSCPLGYHSTVKMLVTGLMNDEKSLLYNLTRFAPALSPPTTIRLGLIPKYSALLLHCVSIIISTSFEQISCTNPEECIPTVV
jgi:hypothetical protein